MGPLHILYSPRGGTIHVGVTLFFSLVGAKYKYYNPKVSGRITLPLYLAPAIDFAKSPTIMISYFAATLGSTTCTSTHKCTRGDSTPPRTSKRHTPTIHELETILPPTTTTVDAPRPETEEEIGTILFHAYLLLHYYLVI